ncbi:MAG TPA: hypothetical protein VJ183_06395 [Chloroflexia bacterium]|nr:hypothetical protein [Chloroflexia bacterium]
MRATVTNAARESGVKRAILPAAISEMTAASGLPGVRGGSPSRSEVRA